MIRWLVHSLGKVDWFTGVIVPIIAVFVGSGLSLLVNVWQSHSAEKSKRNKILHRMKHELERILETPEGQGLYPALEFHSGSVMLQNTAFTIEQHSRLIELTIELIGEFQRLEIALNAAPALFGPMMGSVSQPTLNHTGTYMLQKFFGSKTNIEIAQEKTNESIKNMIDTSMESLRPRAQQLLAVVEKTLGKKRI